MKPPSARKPPAPEPKSASSVRSASSTGGTGGRTATSAAKTPSAPERPRRTTAEIGSIGRYRLLGRIGEGGMAEVYRAVMTGPEGFERELVLKRILPRLSESGDFKTMFVREAK